MFFFLWKFWATELFISVVLSLCDLIWLWLFWGSVSSRMLQTFMVQNLFCSHCIVHLHLVLDVTKLLSSCGLTSIWQPCTQITLLRPTCKFLAWLWRIPTKWRMSLSFPVLYVIFWWLIFHDLSGYCFRYFSSKAYQVLPLCLNRCPCEMRPNWIEENDRHDIATERHGSNMYRVCSVGPLLLPKLQYDIISNEVRKKIIVLCVMLISFPSFDTATLRFVNEYSCLGCYCTATNNCHKTIYTLGILNYMHVLWAVRTKRGHRIPFFFALRYADIDVTRVV